MSKKYGVDFYGSLGLPAPSSERDELEQLVHDTGHWPVGKKQMARIEQRRAHQTQIAQVRYALRHMQELQANIIDEGDVRRIKSYMSAAIQAQQSHLAELSSTSTNFDLTSKEES